MRKNVREVPRLLEEFSVLRSVIGDSLPVLAFCRTSPLARGIEVISL